MSTFLANEEFISACYRAGFLAEVDDFALWWASWCMGGEL